MARGSAPPRRSRAPRVWRSIIVVCPKCEGQAYGPDCDDAEAELFPLLEPCECDDEDGEDDE